MKITTIELELTSSTIPDRGNAISRDEYIDNVISQLSKQFTDRISFVELIDEKAKMTYSQKISSSFSLTIARENVLGVQLSLSFSVLKQIENLLGLLSHVVLTYDEYEIVLCEVLSGSIIYVIFDKGSSPGIVRSLLELSR